MSFKDWYNKELANDKRSAVYIAGAKRGFEAGQQSKQAEIDALKEKIDSALKLMRQPMRGTTSDLLADIKDTLE